MPSFGQIRRDDGASVVETALSALVMVVVLFSLFELFLAFYTYHYVSYAAREGSRWAIVHGSQCSNSSVDTACNATPAEIQTYIQDLGFPGINAGNLTATTTWLTAVTTTSSGQSQTSWSTCAGVGCNIPGNAVQLTVKYAFPLNLVVYSTTVNLTSTSQMVISQ